MATISFWQPMHYTQFHFIQVSSSGINIFFYLLLSLPHLQTQFHFIQVFSSGANIFFLYYYHGLALADPVPFYPSVLKQHLLFFLITIMASFWQTQFHFIQASSSGTNIFFLYYYHGYSTIMALL
jgi:hypothetical protein